MAPLVPRMHLFEIDDQPWQVNLSSMEHCCALPCCWSVHTNMDPSPPPGSRLSFEARSRRPSPKPGRPRYVIFAVLLALCSTPNKRPPTAYRPNPLQIPGLQWISPARLVSNLLASQLSNSIRDYVFIDFCAGAGGPTPSIERYLNSRIAAEGGAARGRGSSKPGSYAAAAAKDTPAEGSSGAGAVEFVLTDLHPHEENWRKAAERSPNVGYVARSVDASNVPPELLDGYKKDGKKVFRLFNLAFHHFDDPLAKAILKNTVETSDGFG